MFNRVQQTQVKDQVVKVKIIKKMYAFASGMAYWQLLKWKNKSIMLPFYFSLMSDKQAITSSSHHLSFLGGKGGGRRGGGKTKTNNK